MKDLISFLTILCLIGGLVSNCSKKAAASTEIIRLPTVKCSLCKKTIENALRVADGVQSAEVDVDQKKVPVTFDRSKTDLAKIELSIVNAGYTANDKERSPEAYEKLPECCK